MSELCKKRYRDTELYCIKASAHFEDNKDSHYATTMDSGSSDPLVAVWNEPEEVDEYWKAVRETQVKAISEKSRQMTELWDGRQK